MFKILVLSLVVVGSHAGYAGGALGGAFAGSLDSGAEGVAKGGYGGYGLGLGYDAGHAAPGPVSAAIQSKRTYEVVPTPLHQEAAVPQIIEVAPSIQPVKVVFRSISSPVHVKQIHTPGAPGQVESTKSEDELHRVTHEVMRPVLQEVREIIQPYRRVIQEVRPVLEEIHTVVAKGHREQRILDAGIIDGGYGAIGSVAYSADGLALGGGYGGYAGKGGYGGYARRGDYKKGARRA
jgi:hypothetical protein